MSKNNSTLKEELAKSFSSIFSELITDEIKSKREKGISFYEKNVIKGIGISPNSFRYYKNGNTGEDENNTSKVPDLVALYKIKEYFKVPYSYLLGETTTKDIGNLANGIKLGLDDNSISKLENLKKEHSDLSIIKLLLINSIINNDDFLEALSLMLSSMFEKKCLEEELNAINSKRIDKISDYIKYSQYRAFSSLVKTLEDNIEISKLSLNKSNIDMLTKLKNQREWLSVDVKVINEKI